MGFKFVEEQIGRIGEQIGDQYRKECNWYQPREQFGFAFNFESLMNQHKQWQNVIIMIIYLYILFMDNLLSKKMVNFVFGEKSGISCKKTDLKDCACWRGQGKW